MSQQQLLSTMQTNHQQLLSSNQHHVNNQQTEFADHRPSVVPANFPSNNAYFFPRRSDTMEPVDYSDRKFAQSQSKHFQSDSNNVLPNLQSDPKFDNPVEKASDLKNLDSREILGHKTNGLDDFKPSFEDNTELFVKDNENNCDNDGEREYSHNQPFLPGIFSSSDFR